MGALVELLADRNDSAATPDLGLLEELVTRASRTGLNVTLRLEGERAGLPAESVQVAYRVVQESLTNAIRYAAGASVAVVVRGSRAGLAVEVVNSPTRPASPLRRHGAAPACPATQPARRPRGTAGRRPTRQCVREIPDLLV